MTLDVLIEDPRWKRLSLETLAQTITKCVMKHMGLRATDYEISLLACNDTRIAALNADFRGKPQPTNVLSWPSEDLSASIDGQEPTRPKAQVVAKGEDGLELGDIAIAWETCAREAHEAGKTLQDHVTHLIVHGLLHLLGYDHIRDLDATLMEGYETAILGKLGVDDPYSSDENA